MGGVRRATLALLVLASLLAGGCGAGGSSAKPRSGAQTSLAPHGAIAREALAQLDRTRGRAYVEVSRNLPDVIETP